MRISHRSSLVGNYYRYYNRTRRLERSVQDLEIEIAMLHRVINNQHDIIDKLIHEMDTNTELIYSPDDFFTADGGYHEALLYGPPNLGRQIKATPSICAQPITVSYDLQRKHPALTVAWNS